MGQNVELHMQDEFGELPEQKQEHVNQLRRGDFPAQAGEDVPRAAEAANPIPRRFFESRQPGYRICGERIPEKRCL